MNHRPRVLLITLVALLAVALGAGPARAAAANGYVALGDSFASGVGTRTYYADGTQCYRSPQSYPATVARQSGLALTLAACSGATTADVRDGQLASLRASTAYVSLTVGGNDAGFASVLTECAKPSWWGDCNAAIDRGLAVVRGPLGGRVADLLTQIEAKSPNARVVVTGYPHLFNGTDCNAATFFSAAEESRLNAATDELNAVVRRQAAAAGAGAAYADPVGPFAGHAWCDRSEWINGLSYPVVNSYHPNVAGHAAYAGLVRPVLVGGGSAGAATVRLPQVRTAHGPFRFTVPDLDSPAARRAAAAR